MGLTYDPHQMRKAEEQGGWGDGMERACRGRGENGSGNERQDSRVCKVVCKFRIMPILGPVTDP